MKWLLLVMLAFAVTCLWWLDAEHGTTGSSQDQGSTLERGPQGLSLARAWLGEVADRRTALLTLPIARAGLPDHGVVMRVVPNAGVLHAAIVAHNDKKTAAGKKISTPKPTWPDEEPWVARGGRLVLAFKGAGAQRHEPATVVLPALAGVNQLALRQGSTLADNLLLEATPIITAGDRVLVARRRVGAGDVWLIACPEIFTNEQLTKADHCAVLLALCPVGRPVWFDEEVHGVANDDGMITLMRHWGLGPALLVGVLLVGLWFWRGRVLLGPPADPWRDHRAEAVEGVEALAGLYRRALSPRDLLELFRQRLLREVILRTGQRPVSARATVDRLTGALRLPSGALKDHDFQAAMTRINQAFRSIRDEHRRRRP